MYIAANRYAIDIHVHRQGNTAMRCLQSAIRGPAHTALVLLKLARAHAQHVTSKLSSHAHSDSTEIIAHIPLGCVPGPSVMILVLCE